MTEIENKIIDDFCTLKEHLTTWGKAVDDTLVKILKDPFITGHKLKIPPSYRLKDDLSYLSKVLYRQKNYQYPLIDVEDKVGTRLVLLKSSDVEEAATVILDHKGWKAKTTKNIKQLIDDNPDAFNYQSIHIVVSPLANDPRFEGVDTNLLTCEVQVRTLLQHAYAEVSHDSAYKGPYKNDKDIMRHLAKSMALMEATDDYFCRIFELISDQKRKYYNLLNELISVYIQFNNTFDRSSLDYELTEYIFSLLDKKEVQLSAIQEFAIRHKNDLKKAISANNSAMVQQPVIILVAFYFFKHRNFLREEWNISLEALKSIYRAFNTSFDNY